MSFVRDYVYGCPKHKSHPRFEMRHDYDHPPLMFCFECGSVMERIPQALQGFYIDATTVLLDWMEHNYKMVRTGQPEFSKDKVMRPDKPLPQRDYRSR